MPQFPNIASKPTQASFKKEPAGDPTVRAKTGGYVKTWSRYTRNPARYSFELVNLSDTDMATLEAFELTVKWGADAFDWWHPSGVLKTVRFAEGGLMKWAKFGPTTWRVSMTLEEV